MINCSLASAVSGRLLSVLRAVMPEPSHTEPGVRFCALRRRDVCERNGVIELCMPHKHEGAGTSLMIVPKGAKKL